MSLSTIVIILLVLLLIFGLPVNPYGYSRFVGGGYHAPGILVVLLVIVVVLMLMGRL